MTTIKEKRYKWYNTYPVKYELVKAMKNKEVSFIDRENNANTIRGICIRSVNFLNYVFDQFNFYNRDYNIYLSCADYEYIPEFTYNLKKRSSETSKWFEEQAIKEMFGYDILFDFDSKRFSKLKNEVSKVLNILELNNLKLYYFPSGNNFQIIIPNKFNKDNSDINKTKTIDNVRKFINKFRTRFNLKYLCEIGSIAYLSKLRKCPYSLVNDKVVLPLKHWDMKSSKIIESFDYNEVYVNYVLKTTNIRDRGLCIVNDMPEEQAKINLNKFTKKYFLD